MKTKIFINLPTKDLDKATAFYEKIGFTKNPKFSDENASWLAYDDVIHVMLLTHDFFKTFLGKKEIADAKKTTEVLNALSVESREAVNTFFEAAIAAWGKQHKDAYDHGFMYGRDFEDIDGHIWEIFWMDPKTSEE